VQKSATGKRSFRNILMNMFRTSFSNEVTGIGVFG
jgi:hypothetical protein